jgi:putative ATP-dependent endonuclease of the OLD family
MKLSKVILNNYRNFSRAEISFDKKSLVIGANDVGKTNLIDAIRLLLDKSLSENDIEPGDEDFCALYECNSFEIILLFNEIEEECIYAKLGQYINDNTGDLYLGYFATRDTPGGTKKFEIKAGPTYELLEELPGRNYLKVLNLKYVGASRNIDNFLRSQKNKLLEVLKSIRTEEQTISDNGYMEQVRIYMNDVQEQIDSLSYVKSAGEKLNTTLSDLAEHHVSQEIKLGIDIPSSKDLFKKVQLLSYINDQSIQVGGDGRKNQAFIALWAALNALQKVDGQVDEVSIFCIEEPEAHLHPHQQRKLSEYLVRHLDTQVILTSHSPFIATEFDPFSIIRLYSSLDKSTVAARGGVSHYVADKIKGLEFRSNIISSEVYFSDCVLLVEGSSEVIFYKALANQLNIDLDKLNVSILSVEGVGFKRYIELFEALNIPWVIRTDNDYYKVTRKNQQPKEVYRLAGVQRAISFANLKKELSGVNIEQLEQIINQNEGSLSNLLTPDEDHRESIYKEFYTELKNNNIFLAKVGLEEDLYHSCDELKENLKSYFESKLDEDDEDEDVIELMKKKKSTFMFHFVEQHFPCLINLKDTALAEPLFKCQKLIESLRYV